MSQNLGKQYSDSVIFRQNPEAGYGEERKRKKRKNKGNNLHHDKIDNIICSVDVAIGDLEQPGNLSILISCPWVLTEKLWPQPVSMEIAKTDKTWQVHREILGLNVTFLVSSRCCPFKKKISSYTKFVGVLLLLFRGYL